MPTRRELEAIEGAIRDWLEADHLTSDFAKRGFKLNWGSAQRTIRSHPAFALPYFRLEGHEGFTQRAKGWVILSHYFHKQGNSLSDAMLRFMACRLWSESLWQMPEGTKGAKRAREFFVRTRAGYFVLHNSGFAKSITEERTIGWQRPWYISDDPRENEPGPITELVTKTVRLTPFKAGPIVRAIGKELQEAVEHAMGTAWTSDPRLLKRAFEALGLNQNSQTNFQKESDTK